jgi:hypothetical protein
MARYGDLSCGAYPCIHERVSLLRHVLKLAERRLSADERRSVDVERLTDDFLSYLPEGKRDASLKILDAARTSCRLWRKAASP